MGEMKGGRSLENHGEPARDLDWEIKLYMVM